MPRIKKQTDARPPELHMAGGASLVQTITRFWLTLFFVLLVVYATVMVIGRLAGFRDLVRQRLELLTGVALTIDEVRLTPGLNLRVKDIVEVTTNDLPALRVGEAVVDWKLSGLLRGTAWPFRSLKLRDAEVRFRMAAGGTWMPLPDLAGALLPWVSAGHRHDESNISEWMRVNHMRMSVRGGLMAWLPDGTNDLPHTIIEGIDFDAASVRPFGDPVGWFNLRIKRAQTGDEAWLRDLELEWLRASDQDVVIRVSSASVAAAPAP